MEFILLPFLRLFNKKYIKKKVLGMIILDNSRFFWFELSIILLFLAGCMDGGIKGGFMSLLFLIGFLLMIIFWVMCYGIIIAGIGFGIYYLYGIIFF